MPWHRQCWLAGNVELLRWSRRIFDALQAVPVFAKVMGIAVGLTCFYGLGTYWQLHSLPPPSGAQTEEMAAQTHVELQRRLARVLSVMAVTGILGAWLLTRILTHPLDELLQLTRRLQHGDLRARAPVRSRDEVGDLAVAFNEMAEALAQKEAARQKLLRQVIAAEEEERRRVARELHDQTGQALTSLIAGLGALESRPGAVEAARLADLRRLAEQTLEEVHDLSRTLRPAALDDLGLEPALARHCELFRQRSGVAVDLVTVGLGDSGRLPAELELTVYRLVQEALTNAWRHGQASRVKVMVDHQRTRLLVIVADDGKGFPHKDWRTHVAQGQRLGLLGMEERVGLFGGSLCLESVPGGGTQLFAEIPLPDNSHE
jgi:signal transduction histidine kinase